MGCGVSRPVIADDHAPPPAGLSPIRRRFEEIKRNRKSHKRSKSHLSSKELLDDGVDDDDHTIDDSPRKSVSYPLESIDEASDHDTHLSPPTPPVANHLSSHPVPVYHGIQCKPNQVMHVTPPQPVKEKVKQVTHFTTPQPNMDRVIHVTPHSSSQLVEKVNYPNMLVKEANVPREPQNVMPRVAMELVVEKIDWEKKGEVLGKKDEHEKKEEEHHEEEVEEEDDDDGGESRFVEDYGSDFGPGSPSFREYCIFSADNSVESLEIGKDECMSDEEMRRRKDTIVSSEGSVTISVKKQQRGKRFRRVKVSLPRYQVVKGGQVAVKNLLNVRSCYTPCSNPQTHDKPQLASHKSV